MARPQKSTEEFLEQLEKDILSGKTLPAPKQEARLQKDYSAGRATLAKIIMGPGVLPTDNSLEKKRFT